MNPHDTIVTKEDAASASGITTSDLTHRLLRKYGTSEDAISEKYIVATQVRANGSSTERTADAVIIGNWPSAGYEIQGFEIKVSRGDWLNEVKTPNKCAPTKQFCDRWWLLIASESMVKEGELSEDWGLMVAHGTGIRIAKEAPKLKPMPPDVRFITGLMRANKRAHISEDLHAQYLQDHRRQIEADLRKEYTGLLDFAKVIHEAFGIELKQEKRWERNEQWPGGHDVKYWVAKLRSKWSTLNAQQLKALIEAAVSGDMDQAKRDLKEAYIKAQDALETLDKYKGANLW